MFSLTNSQRLFYNYLQAIRLFESKTGHSTRNASCHTIPSIEAKTSPFCALALQDEYPANALSNQTDRSPILEISPRTTLLSNLELITKIEIPSSSPYNSDNDSFLNRTPLTQSVPETSSYQSTTELTATNDSHPEIDTLLNEVHSLVLKAIHSRHAKIQSENSIPLLLTRPKDITKVEKLKLAALPYSYKELYPVNPWFIGETPPPANFIVRGTDRNIQVSSYSPSSLLSYLSQMFSKELNEQVKQILTGQLSNIIDDHFNKKVSQPAYQIHQELQLPGPPSNSLRAILSRLREEYITLLLEVENPKEPDLNITGSSEKILNYLADLAKSEDDSHMALTENKTAPVLHLTLLRSALKDPEHRIQEMRLPMEHLKTGKVLSPSRFARFTLSHLELHEQTLA